MTIYQDLSTFSDGSGVAPFAYPGLPKGYFPAKLNLGLGDSADTYQAEMYRGFFRSPQPGGIYEPNTLWRVYNIQNTFPTIIAGGTFVGSFPKSTIWARMHDCYGLTIQDTTNQPITIKHMRMHNLGDGINVFKNVLGTVTVDRCHFSAMRDDCIQNDFGNPMTISNNLVDGCFIFYSSRPYVQGLPDKSGTTVTINNNLVYLRDMPTTFVGNTPGHGRFFKMDSNATGFIDPKLTLTNNTFRVDTPHVCCGNFMLPPASRTVTVSGNTILWGGQDEFGDFPYPVPTGWTLVTVKATVESTWNAAVAAWKADSTNNAWDGPNGSQLDPQNFGPIKSSHSANFNGEYPVF